VRDVVKVASLELVPGEAIWQAVSEVREDIPVYGPGAVIVHHRACPYSGGESEDRCDCVPVYVSIGRVTPKA